MASYLNDTDLPGLAKERADELIGDAEAQAWLVAPCLFTGPDDTILTGRAGQAAKSILKGIVLRWNDAGTGGNVQLTAGPFGASPTPNGRRNALWPSEITDLQKLCRTTTDGKAYGIDSVPRAHSDHSLLCSVNFGATHCTCGADLTGGSGSLYERDVL